MRVAWLLVVSFVMLACSEVVPPPIYEAIRVERRDIVVSAHAAGTVQPEVTVEVKSKAAGEILETTVETGELVSRGTLMVRVDQRQARNDLALSEAEREVARARLTNAESEKRRAEGLFEAHSLSKAELEKTLLDFANAKADVVRAQVAVENARIQLEDTEVLAPITGTIIEKNVERGQVISTPTRDVAGGTVLLKMADLNLVQVRTLVDETDIAAIRPGLQAAVTVAAYPHRTFEGVVRKIEPQAVTEQNVTMFPVLVNIENRNGLLNPGMNCEVELHVGSREGVLAIPNAALRTRHDVGSAAKVLGLSEQEVLGKLASEESSPEIPASRQDDGQPGGRYIVFVLRNGTPVPVYVRTGLTDLDYSEVVEGLSESDSVLVLPSQGLIWAQERFRSRIDRMTGGGLPGMRSSSRRRASSSGR
jgi:HlyD family secretion protein